MSKERIWEKDGVLLPDGTLLVCKYSGTTLQGEIIGGEWHVMGRIYRSPTSALVDNVTTREGYPTNINGWKVWKVKRPFDEEFIKLNDIRNKT